MDYSYENIYIEYIKYNLKLINNQFNYNEKNHLKKIIINNNRCNNYEYYDEDDLYFIIRDLKYYELYYHEYNYIFQSYNYLLYNYLLYNYEYCIINNLF